MLPKTRGIKDIFVPKGALRPKLFSVDPPLEAIEFERGGWFERFIPFNVSQNCLSDHFNSFKTFVIFKLDRKVCLKTYREEET